MRTHTARHPITSLNPHHQRPCVLLPAWPGPLQCSTSPSTSPP
jgi:hypothetical protein